MRCLTPICDWLLYFVLGCLVASNSLTYFAKNQTIWIHDLIFPRKMASWPWTRTVACSLFCVLGLIHHFKGLSIKNQLHLGLP